MIDLLENLKSKIKSQGFICEIQSSYEEIYPEVRLEPLNESWEHDNLGNRKSKEIEFNVFRYIDKHNFADDVKEGTDFMEDVYQMLKDELILRVVSCRISVLERTDKLLVEVKGKFIIELYKRGR